MILATLLAQALLRRGVNAIHVGHLEPDLQRVAVFMLAKGYGVVEGEFRGRVANVQLGIKLLKGVGEEGARAAIKKGGEVPFDPPRAPQFVFDFSLWDEMTEEERRKTVFQVDLAIATLRRYLWEGNAKFANKPPEVNLPYRTAEEAVEGPCVVLDPKGETAREEDLRSAQVYVIGAIVDTGRRLKDATTRLARKAGYDCPRLKITLYGSVVGVPDEINKIVDVVMRVRLGEAIDEAVLANASKSDLLARIKHEEARGNVELAERLRKRLALTRPLTK
ncbi:MAG: tRNA (adenine(9)-N1)-methyltransferase Trm10 [Thermoprotei archaeon]